MRLRRLVVHGFKSFPDRTELQFHDGTTVVVGPNGCGKSNISDAIRWVLGEQKASAVRSTNMEEIIFQGTAERRKLNRSEVTLVVSNDNRQLPVPYDEVEISRTVFREGGSQYKLNGSSCRLKDILDLCRDTGLGANAYSVIEQRMVDVILSDRADERRNLFEEAAGIGRYKDRRRAAKRKLEGARTDLARLGDIIAEVQTKLRSLARQRKRAKRHGELRSRLLDLEVALASAELEAFRESLGSVSGELDALAQEGPSAQAELATAETELERRRLRLAQLTTERDRVVSELNALGKRVAELERGLAVSAEREAHANKRLEQIAAEQEELLARTSHLSHENDELSGEQSVLGRRERELSAKVAAAQEDVGASRRELAEVRTAEEAGRTRLNELSRHLARLDTAAATAQARMAGARERLNQIDEEEEKLSGELASLEQQGDLFVQQARELSAAQAELETKQVETEQKLADLRKQETDARQSLAAADSRLESLSARLFALESLEREHHGLTAPVSAALAAGDEIKGLVGPLAQAISLSPQRAAAVEETLASLLNMMVVDDQEAVEELKDWLSRAADVEGGMAILPKRSLSMVEALLEEIEFAGQPDREPVLVGRAQRVKQLRSETASVSRERDGLSAGWETMVRRVTEAESELAEVMEELHAIGLDLRRADSDREARAGQQSRAEKQRDDLARQRAELRDLCQRGKTEADSARRDYAEVERQVVEQQSRMKELAGRVAVKEKAWEEAREQESELRVAHARTEAELAELGRRIQAANEGMIRAKQRADALDRERDEHSLTLQRIAQERVEAESELESLFSRRDADGAELRKRDEAIEDASEEVKSLEQRVRELRLEVQQHTEARHRLEMQKSSVEAEEKRIQERLSAEWGKPFSQLSDIAGDPGGDPSSWSEELQRISGELERIGPINMLAVEEYEEESRRLDFLTTQRDDLQLATDDLQRAIREINRTARRLFLETFEKVRANFLRTFETLFEGGKCDLSLANPDEPLESPIEISASPRGKRIQRIHMLSGGERALTALSLLFAIYLVKPSPFCVLDEVDAPLDEANIERFLAMLETFKEDTQFIVITHNRRTIEAADWVYGITMEEAGISSVVGLKLDEILA